VKLVYISIVSLMLSECKVCTQNASSVLIRSVSILKIIRDSTKFPYARSTKRLLQGVHSHLQEPSLAQESAAKIAHIRNSTKCRRDSIRFKVTKREVLN
jgi:hypothetical protein